MNEGRPCIFGEVLFDCFPDGKRVLGGAPFNVAWHLQAFGQAPQFISRVGRDPEGDEVLAAMRRWGMDTSGVQTDPDRPTGRVKVSFVDGEPEYDIVQHCAYDAIEPVSLGSGCPLLYHGSLALREEQSRRAAKALAATGPGIVFVDVNLRTPWWREAEVLESVRRAHWVKLNAGELELLAPGQARSLSGKQQFLAEMALHGLIVTHGAAGAEVVTAAGDHLHVQPEPLTEVVDTVGAGDAFAAITILGLVHAWPLATTLERAQVFAARLVGNRGATVDEPAFYRPFIDAWRLRP